MANSVFLACPSCGLPAYGEVRAGPEGPLVVLICDRCAFVCVPYIGAGASELLELWREHFDGLRPSPPVDAAAGATPWPDDDLPRPRVLIADDDEEFRHDLQDLLTAEGYRAVTAASGREAVKVLQATGGPWIVLLDRQTPDASEVLGSAGDKGDIDLILMTALPLDGSKLDGWPVLLKPITVEALLRAMTSRKRRRRGVSTAPR